MDLTLGDSLDWLAALVTDAAGTVIITDPVWPNAPMGLFGTEDPLATFIVAAAEFPRIARRVVIWLGCASDPRFLAAVPNEMRFVRTCWLRLACPSRQGTILNSGDVAYVFGDHKAVMPRRLLPGEITSTSNRGREANHPTPRKLEHAKWLVDHFTRPGDMVVDPFMGSGTTGVAALSMGRRFAGCERVPEYHAEATRRLAETADGR